MSLHENLSKVDLTCFSQKISSTRREMGNIKTVKARGGGMKRL